MDRLKGTVIGAVRAISSPTLCESKTTMASSFHPHSIFPSEGYETFIPPPPPPPPPSNSGSSQPLMNNTTPYRYLPLPSPSCNTSSSTPKKIPQSRIDSGGVTGSPIPPCIECGKRFSSSKALYGHMRCHPDRPYRGMNPRLNFTRSLMLPGSSNKFTDDEYEVARSLLLLANGPPKPSPLKFLAQRRSSNSPGKMKTKRAWEDAFVEDPKWGLCCNRYPQLPEGRKEQTGAHRATKRCLWDLNLPPPPLEESSPSSSGHSTGPDLKLGI